MRAARRQTERSCPASASRCGRGIPRGIRSSGSGTATTLALYTGDLAPAKIWLDPDLIAGVDTDPEAARQNRIEVLSEAESRDAPVILYHEPGDCLVRVRSKGDSFEAVPMGSGE